MKSAKHAKDDKLRELWKFEQAVSENLDVEFTTSYRVEWKTVNNPKDWELYSAPTTDPRRAESSVEMARKAPGCIDVRCVERLWVSREIAAEELAMRRKSQSNSALKLPIQAEGFGRSPKVAMK